MSKLEQIIKQKLKILHKNYTQTGKEFFLTTCLNPKHKDKKPSFSINITTGYGFCFSCGYKVGKEYWLNDIDNIDTIELIERQSIYENLIKQKEKIEYKEIILPPKNGNIRNGYRRISKQLYQDLNCYLTKTGKYKGSIIFPVTYKGRVVGFESKNWKKSKYIHSYKFDAKTFIFGYEYLQRLNKNYIVFTEGIFDALSMLQLGIPATPNWGVADNFGELKINQLIELGIETIYISFDKDKAGREAEKEIVKNKSLSANFKVKHGIMLKELLDYYKSDCKDFNEYLVKGC